MKPYRETDSNTSCPNASRNFRACSRSFISVSAVSSVYGEDESLLSKRDPASRKVVWRELNGHLVANKKVNLPGDKPSGGTAQALMASRLIKLNIEIAISAFFENDSSCFDDIFLFLGHGIGALI